MLQVIKALLFWRAKATRPQRKGLLLNPIEDFGPAYEYPPLWRKEWDRKHAERTTASSSIVKMDPVVELSQSLKAAGIHPAQHDRFPIV